MIIDFSVENFRSIKEMQTLSMSAANIVSKYKEVDEQNVIKVSDKLSLLKSKAIYGANASGKSNLIKALNSFITIITKSLKDDSILRETIWPFRLSTETENKPCYFQLIFILNDIQYRYGFEATNLGITSEWLFGTPGKKEVSFFTREGLKVDVNERQFKEGRALIELFGKNNNDIRNNQALFLSLVSLVTGGIGKQIINYISSVILVSGLHYGSEYYLFKQAEEQVNDEGNNNRIIELMRVSDIGITGIGKHEFQPDLNKEKVILTTTHHKKYDSKLKESGYATLYMINEESEGTKKMFEISPMIFKALKENTPLIIDEFDARFHPLLTKKIVELFNSNSNNGSQLIFATHDTNLLSAKLLRRDQVCFVEKDKYGSSHFYSLADFKGVRNDASFEKDYIDGRYGAIPFLGDFNSIIDG